MIAQRLVMPVSGTVSWTVVDEDLRPVGPAERYLAHLAAIERSPNTIRAYAHSLAMWFGFLARRSAEWSSAEVDDVSEFVRWLRAPAHNVIVLDASAAQRCEATVNRHLAAVFGLYDFHARAGVKLADSLVAWRRVPRGSFKPFLHHVSRGRPISTRPIKLRVPRRLPATLTVEQITVILHRRSDPHRSGRPGVRSWPLPGRRLRSRCLDPAVVLGALHPLAPSGTARPGQLHSRHRPDPARLDQHRGGRIRSAEPAELSAPGNRLLDPMPPRRPISTTVADDDQPTHRAGRRFGCEITAGAVCAAVGGRCPRSPTRRPWR